MNAHPDLVCRKIVSLTSDYLEGALAPEERARLEQHLVICESCANYVDRTRATVRALGTLGDGEKAAVASRAAEAGRAVIAYKFLKSGGTAPFTGAGWSAGADSGPDSFTWLHASEGPLDPCRNGIHAATREHLIYWLDVELWEVELAGEVMPAPQSLVARSGRLRRRIETWGDRTALAIGRVCVDRVQQRILAAGGIAAIPEAARAYAREAEAFVGRGEGVVAAYAAALARAALEPGADMDAAFHAERREQSLLLARILGIGGSLSAA